MRASKAKGFLLIVALMLTVLISIIAFGLLSVSKSSYSSSKAALQAIQAYSLARSGLGDVWVKLSKDPTFPSGLGDDQSKFSYRENVRGKDGSVIGSYVVNIDRSDQNTLQVVRVESTGILGLVEDQATHHTIYAEILVKPGQFRIKVWEEGTVPKL